MIHYVVTEPHAAQFGDYLAQEWGRAMAPRVTLVFYPDLLRQTTLAGGTYVFTDLDRLTPAERERSETIADELVRGGARVLNHPAHGEAALRAARAPG